MKRLILLAMLFCTLPAMATTWYVNANGGTRYSVNQTSGQCNGQSAAAYPGSGVNQNCAFGDIRYLWTDGTYAYGREGSPKWGWIGSGGDTYLIDCPTDCRVGQSGPNVGDYFGVEGNPYGAGAPAPPSGTAGAHTHIYGVNYANCTSDTAKAHVNGGYGVGNVFTLAGASYVDFACFNITDHSSCGKQGQVNACATGFPLSDFASDGITTNNTTTNVTITDVRVHGLADAGMIGATGTGVSLLRVALVGNASSGWNMDDGSGTTGTGTLNMNYFSVIWNGCAEEYPIVDSVPYQDCTDDSGGGYGDGIGTATAHSSPAWIMTVTNSTAAYNTQDGFDLLHLTGTGSTLTITNSLAYGNMGQQLKVGAASTTLNNLIVGNCNALRQAIPGTPSGYNSKLSDFCRAADTAVFISVQDSTPTTYQFNTLYSADDTGVEIACGTTTCTSLSTIIFENNLFFGFMNDAAHGNPVGSNQLANQIYLDDSVSGLFSHSGSVNSYNATYSARSSCPEYGETNAVCLDPQLTDETWHLYGYGNMDPVQDSRILGMGVAISGVTVDYNGVTRPNPPSMGALEHGSALSQVQVTLNAAPNPATVGEPVTLTATVAQTGSATPTGSVNFMNGSNSLGTESLDNLGAATVTLSGLPVASYSVIGAYSGDSNYAAGQSGVAALQVMPATTSASLATSLNPVAVGQALALSATVGGSGGASLTGTVTFRNGSTVLGTATLNSSGVATLSTTSLAAGTYSLTAQYSGNASYLTSTSSVVSLTVTATAQATTTSLVATPNPVTAGQTLSLTATVSGTTTPSGTVSFLNGFTVLGTAKLNASGVATLSTTSLAAGTYSLTAAYAENTSPTPQNSDSTSYLSSTSSAVVVTVSAPATPIVLPFSLNAGGSTTSQTILPGETAVYTLAVSPAVGTTLPAITFAASGLPAGTTATFSPQTIAAGSGATNVTLSIQTPAQSAMLDRNRRLGGGMSVVALGLLLLPFGGGLRRSGKRMMRFSCMVLLLAGAASLAGLTGCTAGVYNPNAKTYTVTVISTAASMSQTTTVTLTVE